MLQRNAIIATTFVAGAFVTIIVVGYFGRQGNVAEDFDRGQRFKAKPGTTRENAMILTSDKRPTDKGAPATIARRARQAEPSDPLEVKSLSRKEPAERSDPANDIARAALSNGAPEAGLRQLEEALALTHSPNAAAILHEAQGQLYARLEPPDYDAARQAFQTAIAMAEDPDLKEEIACNAVQVMMQAGQLAEAREQIETQLADKAPSGGTGFKLQLLRGQLQERAGDTEAAEATYHAVLSSVEAMPAGLETDEAVSLVRLAGLRLTTLYRSHDRKQAADILSEDLKRQLARMQASAASAEVAATP